eukprot:CAMPEP_0194341178 /NCGR_PEP_ID=MMETSP0171-20130528/88861_1 /TAXON_ID=218684 /ORGANISM="Corethron pennatum, Strain L29A3" /LENGTH=90 /DNA_ID=CAMNT_0039106421 /DNA_START=71 /DNA_END=340 /DNA_ORIENTATION=-
MSAISASSGFCDNDDTWYGRDHYAEMFGEGNSKTGWWYREEKEKQAMIQKEREGLTRFQEELLIEMLGDEESAAVDPDGDGGRQGRGKDE